MGKAKHWVVGVLPAFVALACDGSARRLQPVPAKVEAGSQPEPASASPVAPPEIVRLEPSADCVQPAPVPRCASGYCEIPPGCFIMGAPRGEPGAGKYSNIQVEVSLTRGFLIGQTELTRSAWLETGWGKPKRAFVVGVADCLEPECAVGNVSFFDALRYANWLSEREGLRPCYELTACSGEVGLDLACSGVRLTSEGAYGCEGYRLPTEAEWEYAVRAGTTSAFYGGESVSTVLNECLQESGLDSFGWYCHNSDERPHAVAQKLPNAWGLHDAHGNLGEWVNDLHDGLGYGQGPLVDPRGTLTPGHDLLPPGTEMKARVFRGGGYVIPGDSCTAADRGSAPSHMSSASVGFRLARTITP